MYDVPSQPEPGQQMTQRRWIAWGVVCVVASIAAISAAVGVSDLIHGQPVVEHILICLVLICCLNTVLWVFFLSRLNIPARWIAWSLPVGILVITWSAFALSEKVREPYDIALLAALCIAVFLLQWLTLRRYLAEAASLVIAEVVIYLLLYGAFSYMTLSSIHY
jgi:hypothetical protein